MKIPVLCCVCAEGFTAHDLQTPTGRPNVFRPNDMAPGTGRWVQTQEVGHYVAEQALVFVCVSRARWPDTWGIIHLLTYLRVWQRRWRINNPIGGKIDAWRWWKNVHGDRDLCVNVKMKALIRLSQCVDMKYACTVQRPEALHMHF